MSVPVPGFGLGSWPFGQDFQLTQSTSLETLGKRLPHLENSDSPLDYTSFFVCQSFFFLLTRPRVASGFFLAQFEDLTFP